jgi:hypothetical protein
MKSSNSFRLDYNKSVPSRRDQKTIDISIINSIANLRIDMVHINENEVVYNNLKVLEYDFIIIQFKSFDLAKF